jgi:hypothetical protein
MSNASQPATRRCRIFSTVSLPFVAVGALVSPIERNSGVVIGGKPHQNSVFRVIWFLRRINRFRRSPVVLVRFLLNFRLGAWNLFLKRNRTIALGPSSLAPARSRLVFLRRPSKTIDFPLTFRVPSLGTNALFFNWKLAIVATCA